MGGAVTGASAHRRKCREALAAGVLSLPPLSHHFVICMNVGMTASKGSLRWATLLVLVVLS